MTTTPAPSTEPRTYGNWRRPTSPGIGSLGLLATLILLGGTVAAVITSMIFWPLALMVVLITIITLVPLAIHDHHGRNGFQVLLPRLASAHAARSGHRSLPIGTTQPRALMGTVVCQGSPQASRRSTRSTPGDVPSRCSPIPTLDRSRR